MKKVYRKTAYAIFLAVVISFTAVFSVYAWFVNYVNGDFGFTAGEPDPFTLKIAKISVADLTASVTEADREYAVVQNNKIEANEDGTHLEAVLGNMSFGAIDNVAQLKEENVVYLRLTVPKTLGNTINLNVRYSADDFIELYKNTYDADGNVTGTEQVTKPATLSALLKVEEDAAADVAKNSFLLYDAVVSNTACDATQIAETFESTTTVTNTEPKFADENYNKFVTNTVYEANTADNTVTLVNPDYDAVADGDNYYIYLKVVPNLAVFAYSIEYISDIMPCYMFFKISATFETGPIA